MKRLILPCLLAVSAVCAAFAQDQAPAPAPIRLTIIKITDYAGAISFQISTPDEIKTMKAELSQESKFFSKAVSKAEQAWKADKENKSPFPRNAIVQKKIDTLDSFTKQEEADKKLEVYDSQVNKKDKKEGDKTQKTTKKPTDKDKQRLEEDKKKETQQKALLQKARDLFTTALDELKAGAPAGPAPADAAGAAPADNAPPAEKKADAKKK